MKKVKTSFRGAVGYLVTRLIFFIGIAIGIFGGYNTEGANMRIMTLGIGIATAALIFMIVLHIIIFRMSDKAREKGLKILKIIGKIIGIILLVGIVLLIINIIYGKIQYSKIPEVDESMFYRTEHQTKLPEEEDAMILLNKIQKEHPNNNTREKDLLEKIESAYFIYGQSNHSIINNPYKDSAIGRERYQNECILVYSGEEASCGTWVWNKDTINRILNSSTEYTIIDGEKVSIRDFIAANEGEIKAELENLDTILSMDYYLPNDQILGLVPSFLQGVTRTNMVLVLYYTEKEDGEMVEYLVKLSYKATDIMNHLGGGISILISAVMQDIIDSTINSIMTQFPEEFRQNLAQWYSENMRERDDLIHEFAKGEYVLYNEQVKEYPFSFGSLESILYNFPLYSHKDTKKLMVYGYSLLYNEDSKQLENLENNVIPKLKKSVYNIFGKNLYEALMPRVSGISTRIDWNLYHKKVLINNLKSGKYDMWYNEKQRTDSPYLYEEYKLPTE